MCKNIPLDTLYRTAPTMLFLAFLSKNGVKYEDTYGRHKVTGKEIFIHGPIDYY
jgi:hypothetical protein